MAKRVALSRAYWQVKFSIVQYDKSRLYSVISIPDTIGNLRIIESNAEEQNNSLVHWLHKLSYEVLWYHCAWVLSTLFFKVPETRISWMAKSSIWGWTYLVFPLSEGNSSDSTFRRIFGLDLFHLLKDPKCCTRSPQKPMTWASASSRQVVDMYSQRRKI